MTPSDPACVCLWLEPLRSALPELHDSDWHDLTDLEVTLASVFAVRGMSPTQPRSAELLALRMQLAARHDSATATAGAHSAEAAVRENLLQTLRQVVCGFYDLDLRDVTGPGHGRMILTRAGTACRGLWSSRLAAGELAGIAMTEPSGGTRLREIRTLLVPAIHGGWQLTGTKRWISRLDEAAVFVVFARLSLGKANGRPATVAVVVDGLAPGITRVRRRPAGLAGWAWGELHLDAVPIAATDILLDPDRGRPCDGLAVFDEHFAYYRPLVTATALGGAAGVHHRVTTHLARRERSCDIDRVWDHALIALGQTHAEINAALLAVLHAQRLTSTQQPSGQLWARSTKATGVETARTAADRLGVLIGAIGFTADDHLPKTRSDLEALRFADGMHDALLRSAGRAHLSRVGGIVGAEPTAQTGHHQADL